MITNRAKNHYSTLLVGLGVLPTQMCAKSKVATYNANAFNLHVGTCDELIT